MPGLWLVVIHLKVTSKRQHDGPEGPTSQVTSPVPDVLTVKAAVPRAHPTGHPPPSLHVIDLLYSSPVGWEKPVVWVAYVYGLILSRVILGPGVVGSLEQGSTDEGEPLVYVTILSNG